jgi:hypothetical protein
MSCPAQHAPRFAVGGAVVVELERGADHLVPLLVQRPATTLLSTPPDMATKTLMPPRPGPAARTALPAAPLREDRREQGEARIAAVAPPSASMRAAAPRARRW